MSDTLQQPQTAAEQAEVDFGNQLIWRLVGSTITLFGSNANGEIFLVARRPDGETVEVVIGKDETGDIALYEIETKEVPAQ